MSIVLHGMRVFCYSFVCCVRMTFEQRLRRAARFSVLSCIPCGFLSYFVPCVRMVSEQRLPQSRLSSWQFLAMSSPSLYSPFPPDLIGLFHPFSINFHFFLHFLYIFLQFSYFFRNFVREMTNMHYAACQSLPEQMIIQPKSNDNQLDHVHISSLPNLAERQLIVP